MMSELTKTIIGARNIKVQGIDGGGSPRITKRTPRNKVDGAPRKKSLGLSADGVEEHVLGPVTVNAVIGKKAAEKSDKTPPRSGAKSSKPTAARKLKAGRKQTALLSVIAAAAAEPEPAKVQNADDEKGAAASADGRVDAARGGESPENGEKVLPGAASRPKAAKGSRNDKKPAAAKTPRSVVKSSKKQAASASKEPKVGKATAAAAAADDETQNVQQTKKTDGKVGRRTAAKTADKPKRKNEGKSLETGRRKSLGGAVKDKATVTTTTPKAPPKSTLKPTAKKEKPRGTDDVAAVANAVHPVVVMTDLTAAAAATAVVKKSTKVKRVLKKKRKTVKSKTDGSATEQIVRRVDIST